MNYFHKPLLYCFAISSLLSCSWHRKEIAYVKSSFYSTEKVPDADSSEVLAYSIKTEDQDRLLYRETKTVDLKTGQKTFDRKSNLSYEAYYTETEPRIISPKFSANIIDNDTLSSFYLNFEYFTEDTINNISLSNNIDIFKSNNANTPDSAILKTVRYDEGNLANTRHLFLDSLSTSKYINWTKKALESEKQIPFPKIITTGYKLDFIKSTSYEKIFTSADSLSHRLEKTDSAMLAGNLEVTINPNFNTVTRTINASGGFDIVNITKSKYYYKERRNDQYERLPSYNTEYRLDPNTLDTLEEGFYQVKREKIGLYNYKITGAYTNQHIKNSDIDKKYLDPTNCTIEAWVDSMGNYIYKAYVLSEKTDTFLIHIEDRLEFSYADVKYYKNKVLIPKLSNVYGPIEDYDNFMQAYYFSQFIASKIDIYYQLSSQIHGIKNRSRTIHLPTKKELKKEEKKAKKLHRRRFRTYLFCIRLGLKQRICITRPSFRNLWKRMNRAPLFKPKWKPEHFNDESKLIERSRRAGYEKRIEIDADGDYKIYEIYYKSLGNGNELKPLE